MCRRRRSFIYDDRFRCGCKIYRIERKDSWTGLRGASIRDELRLASYAKWPLGKELFPGTTTAGKSESPKLLRKVGENSPSC